MCLDCVFNEHCSNVHLNFFHFVCSTVSIGTSEHFKQPMTFREGLKNPEKSLAFSQTSIKTFCNDNCGWDQTWGETLKWDFFKSAPLVSIGILFALA